jgi:hypothetical protein
MRLSLLLACLLALTACSKTKTESDPKAVFAAAFHMDAAPDRVAVVNGYRLERSKWGETKQMYRLHLVGLDAKKFAQQRWPDLTPGIRRVFHQGTQTPWFAPGKELKYITYRSPSDPAVTVMNPEGTTEVFIAYDGLD